MTRVDESWLAERERIAGAASPLPWMDTTMFEDDRYYQAVEMRGRDFKFLVDARNHHQALIDEIRRLRARQLEVFDPLVELHLAVQQMLQEAERSGEPGESAYERMGRAFAASATALRAHTKEAP